MARLRVMHGLTLLLGDPWIGQSHFTLGLVIRAAAAVVIVSIVLRLFDGFLRRLQPPTGREDDPGRGGRK